MKYSTSIINDLDINEIKDIYIHEFHNQLNIEDSRITKIDTGFLISSKNIDWPIKNLLSSLDITLQTSRIFITYPHKNLAIHRDCIAHSSNLRQWAINIPVLHCENSMYEWFSDDDNDFGKEAYTPDGSAIIPEYDKEYIVSESSDLNDVKLIRTDVMHRSNNSNNNKIRVALSLRAVEDISYEEIKNRIIALGRNNE